MGTEQKEKEMAATLYQSSNNGEVYCTFHRKSFGQGMTWAPLNHAEAKEWALFMAETGSTVPCEPCREGYGPKRPEGPITNSEAVFLV